MSYGFYARGDDGYLLATSSYVNMVFLGKATITKSRVKTGYEGANSTDITDSTDFSLGYITVYTISNVADSLILPFVKASGDGDIIAIIATIYNSHSVTISVAHDNLAPELFIFGSIASSNTTGSNYGLRAYTPLGITSFDSTKIPLVIKSTFDVNALHPSTNGANLTPQGSSAIDTQFTNQNQAVYVPFMSYGGSTHEVDTTVNEQCGGYKDWQIARYHDVKTKVFNWAQYVNGIEFNSTNIKTKAINIFGGKATYTATTPCIIKTWLGQVGLILDSMVNDIDAVINSGGYSLIFAGAFTPIAFKVPFFVTQRNTMKGLIIDTTNLPT